MNLYTAYTPAVAVNAPVLPGVRSYIFTLTAPAVDTVETRLGYGETFDGTFEDLVARVAQFAGGNFGGASISDETHGDYRPEIATVTFTPAAA